MTATPAIAKRKSSASGVATGIRRFLKDGGSADHATGVQWFFKEEIKSHGWYTAALRSAARKTRDQLQKGHGLPFIVEVADKLFCGRVLEEKVFAVFLLEKLTHQFGESEFQIFESWLDRISSWADHDGLVHYLIAPMVCAEPKRVPRVFEWSKSPDRWHRRAACVALIYGTRQRQFWPEIQQLSNSLLTDEDDMVQKGLGWLLRETVKADPGRGVRYLETIRDRAPRLVLRTAAETLAPAARAKILHRERSVARRVGA